MGPTRTPRRLPDVVTRTRHPVKRAFHVALILGGWVVFVWYWISVFLAPIDRAAVQTFLALLATMVGITAVHLLWVRFNLGIYRSRGHRTRLREVTFVGDHDQLGRPLVGADWSRLQRMGHIVISIEGPPERKLYTSGPIRA